MSRDPGRVTAECSWMAVPHMGEVDCVRILLYRDPVRVIRSHVGIDFFVDPSPYRDFAEKHSGVGRVGGGPIAKAAFWWRTWNERALEQADVIMRVDDIPWRMIADIVGASWSHLRYAIDGTATTVNSRRRADVDMRHMRSVWPTLTTLEQRRERE